MRVIKTSRYTPQMADVQLREIDGDLIRINEAFKGRVRFGQGDDESFGENLAGEFRLITSDATPDTEFTVSHNLGAVPVGRIVIWQDKAGSLYQGPSTGTAWTNANIYLKCDVASVQFLIFILK